MNTKKSAEIELFAAVLAGGRSSRMGCDKRFLEFAGEPLVDRAVRLAREAIGGPSERILLCGTVPGRSCLPDAESGLGPLGGILTVVRQLMTASLARTPWLLVLPVDMPLLGPEVLGRLVDAVPQAETCEYEGVGYEGFELPFLIHCVPGLDATVETLCREGHPSRRSIRGLLERVKLFRLPLPPSDQQRMFNANSPSQWEYVKQEAVS